MSKFTVYGHNDIITKRVKNNKLFPIFYIDWHLIDNNENNVQEYEHHM